MIFLNIKRKNKKKWNKKKKVYYYMNIYINIYTH